MTRRRASPLPARLVVALVLTLAAVLAPAATASAHDALESTNPANGSSVSAVPAEVVLFFEEPPATVGTSVVITGPKGQVQRGAARLVGDTVHQPVAEGAPAGAYSVGWRVTSDDGHVVSGSFTFTAKAARPGTFVPAATSSATAPTSGSSYAGVVGTVVVVLLALVAAGMLLRRRRPSLHGPAGQD